jgi:hypothetical protein
LFTAVEGDSNIDDSEPINISDAFLMRQGKNIEITFYFGKDGVNWSPDLDKLLDIFIFRTSDFSHQVHQPSYQGTSHMNIKLFNEEDDCSNQTCKNDDGKTVDNTNRYFVGVNGMAFAIDSPTGDSVIPKERTRITKVFPTLLNFIKSGGRAFKIWYVANKEDNKHFDAKHSFSKGSKHRDPKTFLKAKRLRKMEKDLVVKGITGDAKDGSVDTGWLITVRDPKLWLGAVATLTLKKKSNNRYKFDVAHDVTISQGPEEDIMKLSKPLALMATGLYLLTVSKVAVAEIYHTSDSKQKVANGDKPPEQKAITGMCTPSEVLLSVIPAARNTKGMPCAPTKANAPNEEKETDPKAGKSKDDKPKNSFNCVDVMWNDQNCGGCGLACETGSSCVRGACLEPVCGDGKVNGTEKCDNAASNGKGPCSSSCTFATAPLACQASGKCSVAGCMTMAALSAMSSSILFTGQTWAAIHLKAQECGCNTANKGWAPGK